MLGRLAELGDCSPYGVFQRLRPGTFKIPCVLRGEFHRTRRGVLLTGAGALRKITDEWVEVLVAQILTEKWRGQDTRWWTPGEPRIWFCRGGCRDRSLC
jgi:hypothetical protein